jgi:uncharacterized protein with HEPN domain
VPPTLADRVTHILEAIEQIERALAGKSFDAFKSDRLLRAAIERLLEIVCEASRRVPDDAKEKEPDLPWQKMIDFGNRLRHAYHQVDPEIVWSVVIHDLAPLNAFAEQIVGDGGK